MNNEFKIDIILTDLDGTLLNSDSECSRADHNTLVKLGKKGIKRVIATGRSLFSIHKVLPLDFPVDYVIFSSGAGIINWKTKKIILSRSLDSENVIKISKDLISMDIDFMIHYPIPENHHFVFHTSSKLNPDFTRRIEIYKDFSAPLDFSVNTFGSACQLLAVIPNNPKLFEKLKYRFKGVKTIRATSPLDHKSIWVEIFSLEVSKGTAAQWLCDFLDINRDNSLSLGNDYNDIDLLEFTKYSYVVENSPDDLLKNYYSVASNNENGLTHLVNKLNLL